MMLGSAAVALLPRWARWPLRLPSLPILEAVAVRPAGDALVRGLRWALSGTPMPDADDGVARRASLARLSAERGESRS